MTLPPEIKCRLMGLNQLLQMVTEKKITISAILADLGFAQDQIDQIRDHHLERFMDCFALAVRAAFVRMNHGKLYGDLLELYFGYAKAPLTPKAALAGQLGVSTSKVDRIVSRAIGRLRHRQMAGPLKALIHDAANTVLGLHPTKLEPMKEDEEAMDGNQEVDF